MEENLSKAKDMTEDQTFCCCCCCCCFNVTLFWFFIHFVLFQFKTILFHLFIFRQKFRIKLAFFFWLSSFYCLFFVVLLFRFNNNIQNRKMIAKYEWNMHCVWKNWCYSKKKMIKISIRSREKTWIIFLKSIRK